MRIFVTGMTGFLGQQISQTLLKKGHNLGTLARNIAASDRTTASNTESMIRGEKQSGISYYFGDLTDYLNIYDVLSNFKPDVNVGSDNENIRKEGAQLNFLGAVNMAEAARRAVPKLKRFIFSGSAEEYGIQTKFPAKETAELHAASPYAVAKIATEKHLKYLYDAYGFPAIIFRNANSYGRKHNHQFVIESMIYQMLKGKSPVKLGDPTPYRDFIFQPDLLSAYVLAATSNNKKLLGESINIGTRKSISIRQLAEKIRKITGYKGKIQWNSFPKRSLEIPKLELDNSKAKKLLKWKPKYTLDQGLKITVSYYS